MSDLDDRIDDVSEGGDDLFGDDDGDDASQIEDNAPIPSDNDSAPDHDRRRSATPDSLSQRGRSQRELTPEVQEQKLTISNQTIFRHGLPKTDGNMQLVKMPRFLRVVPEQYIEDSPLPEWTIENSLRQIPTNLIRYRRNPQTGEMESNANIYKWSDGSMTVQVGEEHYDIQIKPQIPPTSKAYMADRDANRYIAAAQEGMAQLLTVAHVTEEWSIRPDKKRVLEETEQLKERMTQANAGAKEGELIITTTVDPELQKRNAEMAEKERIRAQRKRENAQLRVESGPGGFRKGAGSMGLGDLEGGRRAASGRKRGPGGNAKRNRGRNNGLSDDESDEGNGAYDMQDDFVAPSDEEVSEGEDDDMLDDGDVEFERERPRAKKRQRREEESSDNVDTDADGEPDEDAPVTTGDPGRRRVRRVVSDDDEDDE
ncbi:unnamed protein product [Discula destructiva]